MEQKKRLIADTLSGKTGGKAWELGGYTKDKAAAEAAKEAGATVTETTLPGTDEAGWYHYTDTRQADPTNGGKGADRQLMTDEDYAAVRYEKERYAAAQKNYEAALASGDTAAAQSYKAEMDAAHQNAERIRLGYGYQGGVDGADYKTAGELGLVGSGTSAAVTGWRGNSAGSAVTTGTETDLKSLLEQWKQAAGRQAEAKVDYAVQQAVTELERALADAQGQFREQAESIALDERQAMDNAALYAGLRGDNGGIGRSRYNEIQAAAAKNRQAVRQAQTQLSTDTARQIADLRAQGEFQKADELLSITQTYLTKLTELEQWAAEFGLSEEKFQQSVRQWQAEYALDAQKLGVDTRLSYDKLEQTERERLAEVAEALLSQGVSLTDKQLEALGITREQAEAIRLESRLEAASKGEGGKETQSDPAGQLGTEAWYLSVAAAAEAQGQRVYDYLFQHRNELGLTVTAAKDYAIDAVNLYAQSELDRMVKELGYEVNEGFDEVVFLIKGEYNNALDRLKGLRAYGGMTAAEEQILLRYKEILDVIR